MLELEHSNTIFSILLTINYGQTLYIITLLPFKYVYHQDYYTLNHVKGFYLDVFHMGFYLIQLPKITNIKI